MLRLRQICLVADKLESVSEDLKAVFALNICHRDDAVAKWGLENVLMPVGRAFLEVVAPLREETPAGRYLRRRQGDSGYMVITQTDDQTPFRARAKQLGLRTAYERHSQDSAFHVWQIHPADIGGAFFEIDIQEGPGDDPWEPAGLHWQDYRNETVVRRILGVQIEAGDPYAIGMRWAAVADRPLRERDGGWEFMIDNARLRFIASQPERGDGVAALDMEVADAAHVMAQARQRGLAHTADSVTICGTRFNIVTINP